LAVISEISAVKRLITDSGAPPAAVESLRSRGIEVVVV
jgi:DeoR/GlpR family transcriptional regulator of sugar metabolism